MTTSRKAERKIGSIMNVLTKNVDGQRATAISETSYQLGSYHQSVY